MVWIEPFTTQNEQGVLFSSVLVGLFYMVNTNSTSGTSSYNSLNVCNAQQKMHCEFEHCVQHLDLYGSGNQKNSVSSFLRFLVLFLLL